jgi:hypothetical protein
MPLDMVVKQVNYSHKRLRLSMRGFFLIRGICIDPSDQLPQFMLFARQLLARRRSSASIGLAAKDADAAPKPMSTAPKRSCSRARQFTAALMISLWRFESESGRLSHGVFFIIFASLFLMQQR